MPIAVALLSDPQGRAFLVRKRATAAFMQPGGKVEPGEDALSALRRELREELDLDLPAEAFTLLGRVEAPAANEPDTVLDAAIFAATTAAHLTVRAELEEGLWVRAEDTEGLVLAPLTRDHVLPLAARGKAGVTA